MNWNRRGDATNEPEAEHDVDAEMLPTAEPEGGVQVEEVGADTGN